MNAAIVPTTVDISLLPFNEDSGQMPTKLQHVVQELIFDEHALKVAESNTKASALVHRCRPTVRNLMLVSKHSRTEEKLRNQLATTVARYQALVPQAA